MYLRNKTDFQKEKLINNAVRIIIIIIERETVNYTLYYCAEDLRVVFDFPPPPAVFCYI